MALTVLLDTHVLLWALVSPEHLSERARAVVADRSTRLLVSAASAWEVSTKTRLGKLDHAKAVEANYLDHLHTLGAEELAVGSYHALLAGRFAVDHRDPFDRMIAAQSLVEGVPVLSRDEALDLFPCTRLW